MDEFRSHCDGDQIIVYVRLEDGHWRENAANFFRVNGMKQPKRIDPPKKTAASGQYDEPVLLLNLSTNDALQSILFNTDTNVYLLCRYSAHVKI